MNVFLRTKSVIGTVALMLICAAASADIVEKLKNVVAPKSLEERDWIEVRTPNFHVRSVLDEKDSIELARHLEEVRGVSVALMNASSSDSPVPLEIYVLRNSSQMEMLGVHSSNHGAFIPGLRRQVIVMSDSNGFIPETEILAREYGRLLLGEHRQMNYPRWFNDGFAEYLSTIRKKSGKFSIGSPPEHLANRIMRRKWIHLRQLLVRKTYDERNARHPGLFHAEAWALVHFLYHRPERDTLGRDMARYINFLDAGTDDLEAFESAFDMTVDEVDERVRDYISSEAGTLLLEIESLSNEDSPDIELEVVAMTREQVSLALARIALSQHEPESAQGWFTMASANEETRPHAEAGLGEVYRLAGHLEAAESQFEIAVTLAPEDLYCALDFGKYWHHRASFAYDNEERAASIARAREYYAKAWKLDDTNPETYALYGQTFITEGENFSKAIEMLEFAEAMLPSNLTVRVMLAQAYMGAGQNDDAARAARSVLVWGHEKSNAVQLAKSILAAPETGSMDVNGKQH